MALGLSAYNTPNAETVVGTRGCRPKPPRAGPQHLPSEPFPPTCLSGSGVCGVA